MRTSPLIDFFPRRSIGLSAVWLAVIFSVFLAACGGGSNSGSASPPETADIWKPVTDAINTAAVQFPSGITVEIATAQGVVYSKQVGNFSSDTLSEVASASKWISATVILRLIDQGVLSLDTQTKAVLTDASGAPWSGNLGEASLRDLLSFQSGIPSDNTAASSATTTAEAVDIIYTQDGPNAKVPGAFFSYGNSHMRIAARMAEVKTGKPWAQIFNEQLRDPLAWSASSGYTYNAALDNPNPAGGLVTTGKEYMRFLVMQLNKGLYGTTRLLPAAMIDEQRKEQWRANTVIAFSPYTSLGKTYHYGLGNWRECDTPDNAAQCDAGLRVGSTGAYGFAPWIDVQRNYAAAVMTRQPTPTGGFNFVPSENLKVQLASLIPAILAQNPPLIRSTP
jgi:serine-type D-Ala-D-Ala carboxypeptidase/endopeptidase